MMRVKTIAFVFYKVDHRPFGMGQFHELAAVSVANVLQEPLGRDLVPDPALSGRLINPAGDGPELRPLQIASLRERDLLVGAAAPRLATEQVFERNDTSG